MKKKKKHKSKKPYDRHAGPGGVDVKKKRKKKDKHKKKPKADDRKALRSKASPSYLESHGHIVQAYLGGVEAPDGVGVLPSSPTAQPAAHQLNDWVPAEPSEPPTELDARRAALGDEAAPQTSQEPTLRAWASSSGVSCTHDTASRGEEGSSHSAAPPPAALQDALHLQVSNQFSSNCASCKT